MDMDKPLKRADIICRPMGTEALLYDAAAEAIHVLNPTALFIWNLCDGDHSLQDMEREIKAAFSLTAEHYVFTDIQKTVDTFEKNNLLVRR